MIDFKSIKELSKNAIDESDTVGEAISKLFNKVYERGKEDALEENMWHIDKITKTNMWLIKTYLEDLSKKFEKELEGVKEDFKAMKIVELVYKEQCKKMPLSIYEYGFSEESEEKN